MRLVLFAIALALSVMLSESVGAKVAMHIGPDALGEMIGVRHVKKDKYIYTWEPGGCRYKYKANHKSVREKYKCK